MKNIKINDVVVSVKDFSDNAFKVKFLPRTSLSEALITAKELVVNKEYREKALTHFGYPPHKKVTAVIFTFDQTKFYIEEDSDLKNIYKEFLNF